MPHARRCLALVVSGQFDECILHFPGNTESVRPPGESLAGCSIFIDGEAEITLAM